MKVRCLSLVLLVAAGSPYSIRNSLDGKIKKRSPVSRRNLLGNFAGSLAYLTGLHPDLSPSAYALDDESKKLTNVYFGVGCFWHIQHEMVEAEMKLLGRTVSQLTSLTGYAGGTTIDKELGGVCYHNFKSVADYGKLGHAEVVGMTIPESSIGNFAKEYFNLFTSKGERVDPQDRGPEYRSLIGLPAGSKHSMYAQIEAAAISKGMNLEDGKGDDADTLGKKLVYVMDTEKFPFYQAEVYHQYHDDFQSPAYGKDYNKLADLAIEEGRMKVTGCPGRF